MLLNFSMDEICTMYCTLQSGMQYILFFPAVLAPINSILNNSFLKPITLFTEIITYTNFSALQQCTTNYRVDVGLFSHLSACSPSNISDRDMIFEYLKTSCSAIFNFAFWHHIPEQYVSESALVVLAESIHSANTFSTLRCLSSGGNNSWFVGPEI